MGQGFVTGSSRLQVTRLIYKWRNLVTVNIDAPYHCENPKVPLDEWVFHCRATTTYVTPEFLFTRFPVLSSLGDCGSIVVY